MLSQGPTGLNDYDGAYSGVLEEIDEETIEQDRQMFEGMLRANVSNANTTVNNIANIEYYENLHNNDGFKESICEFYCSYYSDSSIIEEPEDVINFVATFVDINDKESSGDLETACQHVSDDSPDAVKASMVLKALVNGED